MISWVTAGRLPATDYAEEFLKLKHRGNVTVSISINYSKAFDTVTKLEGRETGN